MATLLLLRHGRTTANADGGLAGHRPVELDDTGRAQAAAVGERLRGVPLAAVVSSPLIRCRQTLDLALPGVVAVRARTGSSSAGTATGRASRSRSWPRIHCGRWCSCTRRAVVFPGGEAMAAMAARAVAAVRRWDASVNAGHGPEAVWLACSHGDVIKAIVADALGMHLDLFQRIVADPASVTAIRYTATRPFVLRLNDTGGDLAALVPPKKRRRPRRAPRGRVRRGRRRRRRSRSGR